ncbi:MAG: DUF4124 domain-containing protein [Gammaproteobacteria bacterium]|nr:DUF4124 domain-containing protein [Gammaproteobacteria bacterium]
MKSAALLLLLLPLCAQAAIYRWTDAGGVIHFSQSPPSGRAFVRIDPQVPPPTPAPAVKALDRTAQQLNTEQGERQQAHEAELAAKARRAEDCAKARSRISFLEEKTAHRLFVKGSDGQRTRMTQEQFEQQLSQARAAETASCGA